MTLAEFLTAIGAQGAAQDDNIQVRVEGELRDITGVIFEPTEEQREVIIDLD